ncbi:MAG TPA: hypothetical protein VMM18_00350 [Gemmatimonadaceae bacterium]|nr:hypothetical protein [Gemmatimonadaceae bacterium]
MDGLVAVFISLMPFFAMLPLAVAAVLIVAIIASSRVRDALGEWFRRRLRLDRPAPTDKRDTDEIAGAVKRLDERVDFLERLLTERAGSRPHGSVPANDGGGGRLQP